MTAVTSFASWTRKTGASLAILKRHGALVRIALVLPFVLLCYEFEWMAWRSSVTSTFVAISQWMGIPVLPISPDSFLCHGHRYQFVISCTALDAFFGSIPLLWRWGKSVPVNLLFLSAYFLCLSVVNLVRLEFGFLLFLRGVPWWLSHEAMSGVFYFALFLWLARQRRWTQKAALAHETT